MKFGEVGLPTDPNSSAYAAYAADNIFTSGFYAGDNLTQIQSALGKIAFSAPNCYSPPQQYLPSKTTE